MPTHHPFSLLDRLIYSHQVHLTSFCSNNHLFEWITWKWHNHIGWAISFWYDNSVLLLEFGIPYNNLTSFIPWNKWLCLFTFCKGRYWSWMPTYCFYAFLFLPKVNWTISHAWNNILFLLAFIGAP